MQNVTSFYFKKLKADVEASYGVIVEDYAKIQKIMFDCNFVSHYDKSLEIETMVELNNQCLCLYNGTNEEKEKARLLWENLYNRIKEYEYQIESDYEFISKDSIYKLSLSNEDRYCFKGIKIYDIIKSLHEICFSFHQKVEPFYKLQNQVKEIKSENEITQKYGLYRNQVIYLVHKSGLAEGNGKNIEWAALLHLLTGISQHTIRQDFGTIKSKASQCMQKEQIEKVDRLWEDTLDSLRQKK